MKNKVALIVLDGWGHREDKKYNSIAEASSPTFDEIWANNPHGLLEASGKHVGLPEGQMGNSEVGHQTIGAGKIIKSDLTRITESADNDEFKKNPAFLSLFDHVRKHDSVLHILGLIGPGGVHCHDNHLLAFITAAKKHGVRKVAVHCFTDGRDTPPQGSSNYLAQLEKLFAESKIASIATISGRFFAMDRDKNWERTDKTVSAIFNSEGEKTRDKPSEYLKKKYTEGVLDEHVKPVVFLDDLGKSYRIEKNDGVFFTNFRSDRTKQLSQKIIDKIESMNLHFVTMTEYDPKFGCQVAFPPQAIETTLAREISKAGLTQVHVAETEKFSHATYFLNGGKQKPHQNEKHLLIESNKDIDTHDKKPEMKAREITVSAIESLKEKPDFLFVNYANPDMVGHTGNTQALKKAIEIVDDELKKIVGELRTNGFIVIITADHGNAEISFDEENNAPHTAHTTNQVPFIVIGKELSLRKKGTLADICPTILELFNIPMPKTMTGKSLIL